MKRIILILLSVTLLVAIPMICPAGSEKTVTILFTGDLSGQVTSNKG